MPVLAAALTIPFIIQLIGLERFGLLTIAWGMIAHTGLFDLGIGRATTQYVSRLLGQGRNTEIPGVISLAITMSMYRGVIAGAILALLVLTGIHRFLNTSPEILKEVQWAGLLLAVVLPLQAISATYRGVCESYSAFRGIGLIRLLLGVLNFVGTLVVGYYTVNLVFSILVLLFTRILGTLAFRELLRRHVDLDKVELNPNQTDSASVSRELNKFGGWFTAGSGASFVLNQSERVAIGVMISVKTISAFAIPAEVVIQSLAIVTAIATIAFPQLSKLVQIDPRDALLRFHRWVGRSLALMFVVCVCMAIALPAALRFWVGAELPMEAIYIGQWLCLGVLANTINILCFSMLHAYGKADSPAKVRIVEMPVQILILFALIQCCGDYGAAYAYILRNVIDSAALYWLIRKEAAIVENDRRSSLFLNPIVPQ